MKPIKLTLQAFGSYGKKTEIDFTKPNQQLFLVTGDTGAGKTTIFDAIVFAIYGEASSGNNKKDGAELQSQYVGYEQKPYVELCFREGEQRYTVMRVPRHRRPVKRGAGTTDEKESVSLTMPDGTEYSSNTKETDKKLEDIVGLSKDQFMQIGMIAQGEFMELLRAKSDEKRVIFRKLFHTEIYQNIVDELGRRCKEKQGQRAKVHTFFQTEVGHTLFPEKEETIRLRALKQKILEADKASVSDMEEFLEGLSTYLENLKEERKESYALEEQAEKDRDAQMDRLSRARELIKSFAQLEETENTLRRCREKEKEIKEAQRLEWAIRDAYDILVVHRRYLDGKMRVSETEEKLIEQKNKLPQMQKIFAGKREAEKEAAKIREQEFNDYSRAFERVEKAREVLDKLEKAKDVYKRVSLDVSEAKDVAAKKKEQSESLELREKEQKAEAESLSDAGEKVILWERQVAEAEGFCEELNEVRSIGEAWKSQKKTAESERTKYLEIKEKYDEQNGIYSRLRTAYFDAQAGILASELEEGKPCPVCGSLVHPMPCRVSAGRDDLTREALEKEEQKLTDLAGEQELHAKRAQSATDLMTEKESRYLEAAQALAARMKKNLRNVPEMKGLHQAEEFLNRYRGQLDEEGKERKKNAQRFKWLQESLRRIDEEKASLKEAVEAATKAYTEAERKLSAAEADVNTLRDTRDFATREEADEYLQQINEKKTAADLAYRKAKDEADEANTRYESARALMERYELELPGYRQEAEKRQQEYRELTEKKNMDDQRWKEITQAHQKEEADEIRAEIEAFRAQKKTAENGSKMLREIIGDQSKPDIEEIEEVVRNTEQILTDAKEKFRDIDQSYQTNMRALEALKPGMEEWMNIAGEYARIAGMYDRFAGKVSGARMDIETYVQRMYLERILTAANRRFLAMTAGQFALRTYDLDRAGEGRNKGLDLMVYSAVTGKVREVRTLSGGESFMAALALALGMADQISESAASIRLDVMFIDEGFGSLDDHSRAQAIKVLQQMAGGSKMVGIISHVTELKQEIEDQLIITKDDQGSHATWQIS